MGRRKKKHHGEVSTDAPELNIMPFIDIFSMLNTFLLLSAAFIGLGIIEVQIPFLSNSTEVKEKPTRFYDLKVEFEKDEVKISGAWTAAPVELFEKSFKYTKEDLKLFHSELVKLKQEHTDVDLVTVLAEPDVKYNNFVLGLDEIKFLHEGDPPVERELDEAEKGNEKLAKYNTQFLFKKIVIGSIAL